MTEEQIKQKAEAEADKVIIGSGMDRASVIHLRHLLVTMYMQGATEATKELEKENAELKKNYEDSLVTCGVLKKKVELLAQPSPLESMQDVLITTQKAQNEKQREHLTKAKKLLKKVVTDFHNMDCVTVHIDKTIAEAEQFLKDLEK